MDRKGERPTINPKKKKSKVLERGNRFLKKNEMGRQVKVHRGEGAIKKMRKKEGAQGETREGGQKTESFVVVWF